MEENNKTAESIQKKISTVKYVCDSKTHLILNQQKCLECKEKTCTFICPANVYSIDETTGNIIVQYENCLECGACRIVCPKCAINWNYPSSGCGIILKNS